MSFLPTNMHISWYQYTAENAKRQLTLLLKSEATWMLKTELVLEAETVTQRKHEHCICSVFKVSVPNFKCFYLL